VVGLIAKQSASAPEKHEIADYVPPRTAIAAPSTTVLRTLRAINTISHSIYSHCS